MQSDILKHKIQRAYFWDGHWTFVKVVKLFRTVRRLAKTFKRAKQTKKSTGNATRGLLPESIKVVLK